MNAKNHSLLCDEPPLPSYLPPVSTSEQADLFALSPNDIFGNDVRTLLTDWFCGDALMRSEQEQCATEMCSDAIECATPERLLTHLKSSTPTHDEPDDHWATVLATIRNDSSPMKQFLHPATPVAHWRASTRAQCTNPI